MLKILITQPEQSDGCTWYRLSQFAYHARKQKLADVQFLDASIPEDQLATLLDITDIFVMRLNEKTIDMFKDIRGLEKPIVIDIDDRYEGVDPFSNYYEHFGVEEVYLSDGTPLWIDGKTIDLDRNKKMIATFDQVMRGSDGIITTTLELQRYAQTKNKMSVIIPNAIDPYFFPNVPKRNDHEVRVMWSGGSSHYSDLAEVVPAFSGVLKRNPQVRYHHVGQEFEGIIRELNAVYHRWVKADGHSFRLACINADIGIAPLRDMEFNYYKSSVKFYEYAALRIPTIARNILPYKDDIQHGVTGFLYDTPEQFAEYLQQLIDDPVLRIQIGNNAYNYVRENREITTITQDWVDFLRGVVLAHAKKRGERPTIDQTGENFRDYYVSRGQELIDAWNKEYPDQKPRILKTDCYNEAEGLPAPDGVVGQLKGHEGIQMLEYEQEVIDKALSVNSSYVITQGDIRLVPFQDNSFDLVMDFSTMDHVKDSDVPTALGEYARVLGDGGRLLLIAWYSDNPEDRGQKESWQSTNQYFLDYDAVKKEVTRLFDIADEHIFYREANGRFMSCLICNKR